MRTDRSLEDESCWLDINEAATLLAARPGEVECLVRDGNLCSRRGTEEIAVCAAEVVRLAEALNWVERRTGPSKRTAPNTKWGSE